MRNLLLVLLTFLVLPCFSLGGMDAEEVQEYLLNIDGLEIISDSWNRGYSMYYKGDDGNPLYDDLNNDPKTRAIIDSVDGSIRSLTKRGDLLYVFFKGRNVNVYTITNGELYMQTKIEEQGIPFYWEQAGLFVYRDRNNAISLLRLYDLISLDLQQEILLPVSDFYNYIEYNSTIGFSDTKLIVMTRYSLLLYDVFSNEVKSFLNLEPVFINSKGDLSNLHKVDENTIGFTISKRGEYFVCQYDVTKMVF